MDTINLVAYVQKGRSIRAIGQLKSGDYVLGSMNPTTENIHWFTAAPFRKGSLRAIYKTALHQVRKDVRWFWAEALNLHITDDDYVLDRVEMIDTHSFSSTQSKLKGWR